MDSSAPSLQLKPKSNDGNKLIVGLIDTTVQSLGANLDSFMLPQIHVAGDVDLPADQLTHGTAMAETIMDSLQAKTGRKHFGQNPTGGCLWQQRNDLHF